MVFKLSPEHEAAFRTAAQEDFLRRAVANLRASLADETQSLTDAQLSERVAQARTLAEPYALVSELDVTRFAATSLLIGDGFDKDPRHDWSRVVLAANKPPNERSGVLISIATLLAGVQKGQP